MPFNSFVAGVGGHLQDGAVDLQVTKNGNVMCDIKAGYGAPGYTDPCGTKHLSSMDVCRNVGSTQAGDKWSVTANYDFTQHPPMMGGYGLVPVTGVAIAYVADPSDDA
jgi:hypothetical protein